MNNESIQPRAVVSAIIEKYFDGVLKIFVQTRWKPKNSPKYLGVLEIPAGGVDGYENVYSAVVREVKEETGLDVVEFLDDDKTPELTNRPGDTSHAFRPFICQQMLASDGGLPWVGFVFRCLVEGTPLLETDESKDLRWLSLDELESYINDKPNEVFGLQYATLKYYLNWRKNNKRVMP